MNQTNFGGENYQVKTGDYATSFLGGVHHHYPQTPDEIVGVPQNLPYSGTEKFVGREAMLRQVHEQLESKQQLVITAIQGMGGIGKTELALQYALGHYEAYPGGVCWLRAREDIATQIVKFGETRLNLQIPKGLEDLGQKVAWCWQHWKAGDVLLVLDDVVKYETVKPWLPQNDRRFCILLTTRETLGSGIARLELDVLSDDASLELLESLIGAERLQAEKEIAQQLCAWVGNLPLGLELIGRYLANKPDLALARMLERLEKKRLESPALQDTTPEMTAQRGVKEAFDLSWEALAKRGTADWSQAQLLAGFLSLFAVAPIPWEVAEQSLAEWDEEALEDAQAQLVNLHLLSRIEKGRYQVHTLIREFYAGKFGQLTTAEQQQWIQRAIAGLNAVLPNVVEVENWQLCAYLVPHVQAIADQPLTTLPETTEWERLLHQAGVYLYQQGRYGEAEPLLVRSLGILEQQFGGEHPAVASSLNNLAELYRSQGRYGEAEPLYRRSLGIWEQQLEPEYPEVAKSLNNLALLYQAQGRYAEAEPLVMLSLGIMKWQLGAEHPNVANSLDNLALLYQAQGHYAKAESLLLRSFAIREQQLGAAHPAVATSLNNLAELYRLQGRYDEAKPLYVRSISIKEQHLGAAHPAVANSLNNLALLYYSQRRYAEAEPLYVRSLGISERQLGAAHPDVATSLNNLAGLYQSQGRYAEAEPLYARSLAILTTKLGLDHPNTKQVRENLAMLYDDLANQAKLQGRYDEVVEFLEKAIVLRQAIE